MKWLKMVSNGNEWHAIFIWNTLYNITFYCNLMGKYVILKVYADYLLLVRRSTTSLKKICFVPVPTK